MTMFNIQGNMRYIKLPIVVAEEKIKKATRAIG